MRDDTGWTIIVHPVSTSVESEIDNVSDDASPDDQPVVPDPLRVLRRGVLGSLQAAFVATLVLEASTLGIFFPRWFKDQVFDVGGLWIDTLVVWVLIGFLWSLIGRLWWTIGLVMALVVTVGAATLVKIQLREEPVYPSDLDFIREPDFLMTMVSPVFLVVALGVVIGIVIASVALGRRLSARYPRVRVRSLPRRQAWAFVGGRVALGVVTAFLLIQATQFNQPGNPWRSLYELRGDQWRPWSQKTNYRSNGFVGGFLYNMPVEAMATPKGYDAARMSELADHFDQVAARINRTRTGSLDDTNVVIVLSESFTDPTRLDGFDLDRDPIPQTRELMASTTSGTMLAQMYGGGTANMEFETLTGQALALFRPQMVSPYQMLVPDESDYPSAVGWFKGQGHDAIAIHPYRVGMYKREQVYDRFGFDEFIHDTTMREDATIDDSDYISDASAFDEVLTQIDAHERPLMVNLVTMQNHIPVDGTYDDPIGVSGVDGSERERVGQYARGLEHTDAALADFLARLEASDEKTVVLFYGDHLPGLYGSGTKKQNSGLPLYETPFFLWSNQSDGQVARQAPITSAAFFLPMLYEFANAPIPPYFALLQEVHERIPAMQQGRMLDVSGKVVDASDIDAETTELLADMRLVQYDFSIGSRYSLQRMWPGSTSR